MSQDNLRQSIAKIIFARLAGQMGGLPFSDEQWDIAYDGWIENPALFPLVETCIDAAMEIEEVLRGAK